MKRRLSGLLAGAFSMALLAACTSDTDTTASTTSSRAADTAAVAPVSGSAAASAPATLLSTLAQREPVPDNPIPITLDNSGSSSAAASVEIDGATITITEGGAYTLSGTLNPGRVIVGSDSDEPIWLILNGVDITNPTGAAIAIMDGGDTAVILADGTENRLADGADFTYDDPAEKEPNATLFSKTDLTIDGDGALDVSAAFNDGIASKDDLVILDGSISVRAADDGIRGKDSIEIQGGEFTINAGGDGLTSDNDKDPERGYIVITTGRFDITADGDAIVAETNLQIAGGEFALVTGGGSRATLAADASAKALKAGVGVLIDGGTFTIDSADDAVHANGTVTVNDGTFAIATGDDALHADTALTVNGGEIAITRSYEGLESATITINDGDIRVVASDDGINVAGGVDGSGFQRPPMGGQPPMGGAQPGMRGGGGFPGGMGATGAAGEIAPGRAVTGAATATGNLLTINGGRIVVDAAGDGLDANGSIVMTGGEVTVYGPIAQGNAALDYDGSFQISGGTLVATGSSGMAQRPGAGSAQPSIGVRFAAQQAGSTVEIRATDGTVLLEIQPTKAFESLVVSSPDLISGQSYEVIINGTQIITATAT